MTLIPKEGAETSMRDMKVGLWALYDAINSLTDIGTHDDGSKMLLSPIIGYKHMHMLNLNDEFATSFVFFGIHKFLVSAAAQGGWYHQPLLTLGFQTCLSQVYLRLIHHCRQSH